MKRPGTDVGCHVNKEDNYHPAFLGPSVRIQGGRADIQFTVQITSKVSLMTVCLNTKIMTVLKAGNSVLRLKTWDH